MAVRALAALAALSWSGSATAQPTAPTVIVPDVAAPLGLGTIVTRSGRVTTIDGGRLAGPNLFHSFNRFDLGRGDTARWVHGAGNPASIANVISRVTGGSPSTISGTIDTTALPNADFYFINPAGIVFGQGARVNVPASAHFSTAQELRFDAGPSFAVSTPSGSIFSVAAPAAFGFLGDQGDIVLRGAEPGFLAPGGSLTLTAGNVTVEDSAFGGVGFGIAAVGPGAAQVARVAPRATTPGGSIVVARSTLRSTGDDGILLSGASVAVTDATLGTAFSPGPRSGVSGPIDIFGGQVIVSGALVSATTFGAEPAGEIRIVGGDVSIDRGSMIVSETARGSTGASGQISLTADRNLRILDGSRVSTSTLSAQRGGDVILRGDQIVIAGSVVASDVRADATGAAGSIDVAGRTLQLGPASAITSTSDGLGDAGAIVLALADSVTLERAAIDSRAQGQSGEAGRVFITAPAVRLGDQSIISTATSTSGRAGLIGIVSDSVELSGASVIESASQRGATGDAGLILIRRIGEDGGRLVLTGGSAIRSDTESSGNAGGITIQTDIVELRDGGRISSDGGRGCTEIGCGLTGNGGNIDIAAERVSLIDTDFLDLPTGISSDSGGSGDAGRIRLTVGDLVVDGAADISSDTFATGRGGLIQIIADTVTLRGLARLSTNTFGSGQGGAIDLDARLSLTVADGAAITSQSGSERSGVNFPPGSGPGGSISISAGDVRVLNESKISTTTFTDGAAGDLSIRADTLLLDRFGLITSASLGPGAGGLIRIDVGALSLLGGSIIDADSLGTCFGPDCRDGGDAGDIVITADTILIAGDDRDGDPVRSIISSGTSTGGNAGDVTLSAAELTVDQGNISSRTVSTGAAGRVDIDVGTLRLRNDARITTSSEPCRDCTGAGHAGDVRIDARDLVSLESGSVITSSTSGDGNAGTVEIFAPSVALAGNSRITSSGLPGSSGRTGRVSIGADRLALVGGSSIETVSRSASAAGEIGIDVRTLLLDGPATRITSANQGNANGAAGEIFILGAQDILISDGARITTSSLNGRAGDIGIGVSPTGMLRLESRGVPSGIETSSGPGTGGRITIASPFAVVSNGGTIQALGQQGGANVQIVTRYFISSSDRTNLVAVDGNFLLEAAAYDVSSGTVNRDLSVLDASGVLRGQCASARATGAVSQLVVRPIGPYGSRPAPTPTPTPTQVPAPNVIASLSDTIGTCS